MSVLNKYANLPGIAVDQPDLYESNAEVDKLPNRIESPVNFLIDTELAENINLFDIDAKQAFKVFEKSNIGGADFEELIGYKTRNYDHIQSPNLNTNNANDNQELVLQKFERLEKESQHLINQLKSYKSKEHQDQDFGKLKFINSLTKITKHTLYILGQTINPQAIVNNLQSLKLQLKNNINENLVIIESKDVVDFVKVDKSIDSNESKIKSKNLHLSQLLINRPNLVPTISPIEALEKRIDRIEMLLNRDQDKIASINSYTNGQNLTESINVLNTRVGLLDNSILEQLDGRVTALLSKLNKTLEKKYDSEGDIQQKSKISQLHEAVLKAEKNMAAVCDLTSRLNISAQNQEEALKFAEDLWNLDNFQQKVHSDVKLNQHLLKLLQENFKTKMETIKSSLTNLDERIKALKN